MDEITLSLQFITRSPSLLIGHSLNLPQADSDRQSAGDDFYDAVGGKRLSAHTAEWLPSVFSSLHDCQPCCSGWERHATAPPLSTFSSANAELMLGLSLAQLCPEVELSHRQSSACGGSGNLAAFHCFFFFSLRFPPWDKCPGMSVNMWKFAYLLGDKTEIFVFHRKFC